MCDVVQGLELRAPQQKIGETEHLSFERLVVKLGVQDVPVLPDHRAGFTLDDLIGNPLAFHFELSRNRLVNKWFRGNSLVYSLSVIR